MTVPPNIPLNLMSVSMGTLGSGPAAGTAGMKSRPTTPTSAAGCAGSGGAASQLTLGTAIALPIPNLPA